MKIQEKRGQMLQILYEEHALGPLHTFDAEELARRMGLPWGGIRNDINFLKEKGYIAVHDRKIRVRTYHFLHLTANGIELVEGKLTDESVVVPLCTPLPEPKRAAPDLTSTAGAGDMDYELGLRTLKPQLQGAALDEFLVYEARLRENLKRERLFGDSETARSERAAVVHELNRLARTQLGLSFNDLCQGTSPAIP